MTEQLARSLYKQPQPGVDGVRPPALTYGRIFFSDANYNQFSARSGWLVTHGLDGDVLLVGSAFGYLMENLIADGISNVWGIDAGSWFWDAANSDEWATGMKARTANDWIGSGTEKASLDALPEAPAKFEWIISEDAATMHSDAELLTFIAGCEALLQDGGRIVHLVTPVAAQGPGDSAVNWKTLADWKLVAPGHTWVDTRTIKTPSA